MKSTKKRFSFLTALLLALNIGALLLLLASYLAYYMNPSVLPILAFAGLAYPYILLANIIFMLVWLLIRPKYALLSLILILLGLNHTGRLLRFGHSSAIPEEAGDIRVLSYNIQNFIKYNTSSTKYLTDFENEKKINEFVTDHKADIVCLQEVLNDRENHQHFIHEFGNKIHCPNTYARNYFSTSKAKVDAIAIFTKYPILKTGYLEFDKKTIAIFADLLIQTDTIRLYNLHLASIHFQKEDIDFISDLAETQEQDKIKTGTRNVLSKLKQAFIKRGKQVELVSKHVAYSPYPVIICGDFNDTPASYTYRKLSKGMQDAFVEKGAGFGITYAGEKIPAFRIDYMLFDPHFEIKEFEIHDINLSDHYPLSARVSIKKTGN